MVISLSQRDKETKINIAFCIGTSKERIVDQLRCKPVCWHFYLFIFQDGTHFNPTRFLASSEINLEKESTRIVLLWAFSGKANRNGKMKNNSFSKLIGKPKWLNGVAYRHISQRFAADWTSVVGTSICLKLNISEHLLQA
jgi:hypothetical protein